MQSLLRLCWKENRESGPFVLIGVLLPLLCLLFPKFRGEIVYTPITLIFIMVVVWAAARAQERRDAARPIAVPLRLLSRYLLPLPGVMVIGIALGCLIEYRLSAAPQIPFILLTIGMCVFLYACCTILSAIYTLIPAVLAGLYLAICYLSFINNSSGYNVHALLWLHVFLLVILFANAAFWEAYHGKYRVVIGRLALPLLLLLAGGWSSGSGGVINEALHDLSHSTNPASITAIEVSYNIDATDATSVMDFDQSQPSQFCLRDLRIPRRYCIAPKRLAPPGDYLRGVDCRDPRQVLFLAQTPKDVCVRLLGWDAVSGRVDERFRFTGLPGMIASYCFCSPSPDYHYLLLDVPSKIGGGDDLWLLDLQCKRATLVAPNVEDDVDAARLLEGNGAVRGTGWAPRRLLIQMNEQSLAVDLDTLCAAPLRMADLP